MTTPKVKSGGLTRRLAAIVVGWRLRRRDSQARQQDAQGVLAELAQDEELHARDLAAAVQKAAERRLWWQFALTIVALVLLVAVVLLGGGYGVVKYGVPWAREVVATRQATPIPPEEAVSATPEPTPSEAIWRVMGHLYGDGTQVGVQGTTVRLHIFAQQQWEELGEVVTDSDGAFTFDHPAPPRGQPHLRLSLELPAGWSVVRTAEGQGWKQVEETPLTLEGAFGRPEEIGEVTIYAAIQRSFTGAIYFEGENAPESAVVELRYRGADGQLLGPVDSVLVERPPESPRSIVPVEFILEHITSLSDVDCQVAIAPAAGEERDWAASIPREVGRVEGSVVWVQTGQYTTDVEGIVFAGPLPITLTYEMADFEPSYNPDEPGVWRDEFVREVTYPFATREERDDPRGMRAYWPVYLPGRNVYEIWVAIPGARSSAVVSYTLHYDEGGRPGVEVPGGVVTDVAQCRNDEEEDKWAPAAVYPAEAVGEGGLLWLVVDESRAHWPEGCTAADGIDYQFRMPVWKVEIRRTNGG
jgi:hypothetical protein